MKGQECHLLLRQSDDFPSLSLCSYLNNEINNIHFMYVMRNPRHYLYKADDPELTHRRGS